MKQLKFSDVAHFYIGACRVQFTAVYKPEFQPMYEQEETLRLEHWNFGAMLSRKDAKPILRRIPDEYPHELQEFLNEHTKNWADVCEEFRDYQMRTDGYHVDTEYAQGIKRLRRSTHWNTIAIKTLWLTSKGYDVFGLIDSGQAIDMATLKGGRS